MKEVLVDRGEIVLQSEIEETEDLWIAGKRGNGERPTPPDPAGPSPWPVPAFRRWFRGIGFLFTPQPAYTASGGSAPAMAARMRFSFSLLQTQTIMTTETQTIPVVMWFTCE
jgi:hypothetical protein